MTIYMLRDNKTGLYFKRGSSRWQPRLGYQQDASVWTNLRGPRAAMRILKDSTLVILEAKEVG